MLFPEKLAKANEMLKTAKLPGGVGGRAIAAVSDVDGHKRKRLVVFIDYGTGDLGLGRQKKASKKEK